MTKRTLTIFLLAAAGLPVAPANADDWLLDASVSATTGSYLKTSTREKRQESIVTFSGKYLEEGGLMTNYHKTRISLNTGAIAIEQVSQLFSGHKHFQTGFLPGRATFRLDYYRIDNNDATGDTDNVSAYAPQLSWLSANRGLYLDVGYAESSYLNQLQVRQLTPTLGFALNNQADWVQLRAYYIYGMNPARADGRARTGTVETKWTHFFAKPMKYAPNSAQAGISIGERRFAVDMDEQTVANLDPLERGVASLQLMWELPKKFRLTLTAKQSRFRDVSPEDNYKINSGTAKLTYAW